MVVTTRISFSVQHGDSSSTTEDEVKGEVKDVTVRASISQGSGRGGRFVVGCMSGETRVVSCRIAL